MPKHSKATESHRIALDLLHGGRKVPEGLLRRHMAGVTRRLEAGLMEKGALERQVAKYRSKLHEPVATVAGRGSDAARAVAGLRPIERLAKHKLVTPVRPRDIGGILAGSYSVKVVPPYDFAFQDTSVGFGNPDVSATGDKNSGQMSCYIVSDTQAPSGATASSVLGVFFIPRFPLATLRVSVDPALAFFWWVNATPTPDCHFAWSRARLCVAIEGFLDGQNNHDKTLWDDPVRFCGQNDFDFGSIPDEPLSTQLKVDSSHFYVVSLMCWCQVMGDVWPGSRGVASLAVTLPSFTLDVQAIPILEQ